MKAANYFQCQTCGGEFYDDEIGENNECPKCHLSKFTRPPVNWKFLGTYFKGGIPGMEG